MKYFLIQFLIIFIQSSFGSQGETSLQDSDVRPASTKVAVENQSALVPLEISEQSPCRTFLSGKNLVSLTAAGLSSLCFGFLGKDLGDKADDFLGYFLFVGGFLGNCLLYHKNHMELGIKDFYVSCQQDNRTVLTNVLEQGTKYFLAIMSGIPIAYINHHALANHSVPLAIITDIFAFVCPTLLYYKAETKLVNEIKERAALAKLKDDMKEEAWFFQLRLEELSGLSTEEIDIFYDRFCSIKSLKAENRGRYREELMELMRDIKSRETDSSCRYWSKEVISLTMGIAISGVFGGMYLYKICDPIFADLLRDISQNISSHTVKILASASACALAIGTNALQVKSTYDFSKFLMTKGLRRLDKSRGHAPLQQVVTNHNLVNDEEHRGEQTPLLSNKEYSTCNLTDYFTTALAIILGADIAATRIEICLEYLKKDPLLTIITTGTAVAFFSVYFWALNTYFDSLREVGRKKQCIANTIKDEVSLLCA